MSIMASDAAPHEHLHALYRDHNSWLRGWLRHRLNNSADAADLAQDTFVRLLLARSSSTLQEPRRYLATIARGLVIDLYRRRSLEQAYLDALMSRPEQHAPSAETRALILDSLLAIDRLLDGLGARTRQIFLAVQLDGLSYEKAAERCGVSVSTVRKHLARGLMHCLLLDEA
ncbi:MULTISPECIES: sigma-70 family RNA polymerase sigma factor [Pseudomonas]|uniref:sigma-70 family RNA polymerase sigma factor n=1 Tax=Pseudomonas TaxID=286 RepID=UPI000D014EB0|nr:sigma-70 family RNA polymerase sigma factor [Pseudomonas sp. LLC-1]MDR2319765.1 sigma-70 family RNA polymerase sigma factor [Pseudomonas sp.]PRN02074.1 RNA polymerase subunit sigma [Pseudomonas sp. LLC-1]